MCVCERVCVYVCVISGERECARKRRKRKRERERKKKREIERAREREETRELECESADLCVFVCECV